MLVLIRKHLKDNRDFGDVLILFCNLRKSVYLSNLIKTSLCLDMFLFFLLENTD